MIRQALLITTAGVLLSACATDTVPTLSSVAAPAAWNVAAQLAPELAAADPATDRWWTAIGDPVLDDIVEQAGDALDVRISEARLFEAQARLGSARAALRPEIGGQGTAERQSTEDLDQETFQALVSFSLNPDLNGAVRTRAEAERLRTEAEAARVEAARLSARSTAVQLYAAYREAEARAVAGDQAVQALEESLSLADTRERAGLTSGLDAASARAALASARARPIAARQAAEEARLGLEALLGLNPGTLTSALTQPINAALETPAVRALSAPAAVLARRPDLRAAEFQLWAAGADTRAARRDFWPTLTLSAALGGQELDPETPFTASGFLGQIAGGLTAPLFSFGRLENARDAADARRTQAEIAYRQAAVDALSEVEAALVALASAEARAATLAEAVAAADDQTRLASQRYRGGVSPFLEVLAAQRAAADARAEQAAARGQALAAYARLNAAAGLGGMPG
jgi:NodT family efflux transporter outer membrane factor (OMF) lipoprotein